MSDIELPPEFHELLATERNAPDVPVTIEDRVLARLAVTTLCPSGSDRMEYLCNLVANSNIDLSPLFTHRMKLDDMPKAYDLFRSKAEGVLKIAVTP